MREAILFILNLIDAIVTVYWVQLYGLHVEANPMMGFVLSFGAAPFILLKLSVMAGLIYIIRRGKYEVILNFSVFAYLLIVCMNLYPTLV